jgi:hypothetical protein
MIFFVEGVEEVLEDDALTLQASIGSILASLACLEGDQSTVKTTALLFFLLYIFCVVGEVQRILVAMVYVGCVGDLAAVVVEPQEVSRQ